MANLPAKKSEIERRKPDLRPPWCETCNRPVDAFTLTPIYHPPVMFYCEPMRPVSRDDFYLQWNYEVVCHGDVIRGVVGDDGKLYMTGFVVNFGGEWR